MNAELRSVLKEVDTKVEYKKEVQESTIFVYKLGLSNMQPTLLMNGQVYGPTQVRFLCPYIL